jgi:hypothetical protein
LCPNDGAPVHYFSYKTTRPGGFLPYFFSPAAQSVTTVSGGADAKTKINRALTEDIKTSERTKISIIIRGVI